MIYLLFALPHILEFGRRFYSAPIVAEPITSDSSPEPASPVDTAAATAATASSRFDLQLVIGSWLYEAVLVVLLVIASTKPQFIFRTSSRTRIYDTPWLGCLLYPRSRALTSCLMNSRGIIYSWHWLVGGFQQFSRRLGRAGRH